MARADRRRHRAAFRRSLTFVVLTGLTRIVPTHQVVVGFLLANALAALFLVGGYRRARSG